ncbi:hypothetical protein ES708_34763 [subsurface metagenome]
MISPFLTPNTFHIGVGESLIIGLKSAPVIEMIVWFSTSKDRTGVLISIPAVFSLFPRS